MEEENRLRGQTVFVEGRKKSHSCKKKIFLQKKAHLQVDFFVLCFVFSTLSCSARQSLDKTRADLHNRTWFSSVKEDIRLELHIQAVSTRGQFNIVALWTVTAEAVNTSLIPT